MSRLGKGDCGQILKIEDMITNKRYALKIQQDEDMAAQEIATMKKITHVQDDLSRKGVVVLSSEVTPRIAEYGLLHLTNFSNKTESMDHVYIKMPLYDITLHEYLDKL